MESDHDYSKCLIGFVKMIQGVSSVTFPIEEWGGDYRVEE